MASSPGGRFVRARNTLSQKMATNAKFAPPRLHGAHANEARRGTTSASSRKFQGSPLKNASRRGG